MKAKAISATPATIVARLAICDCSWGDRPSVSVTNTAAAEIGLIIAIKRDEDVKGLFDLRCEH